MENLEEVAQSPSISDMVHSDWSKMLQSDCTLNGQMLHSDWSIIKSKNLVVEIENTTFTTRWGAGAAKCLSIGQKAS